MSAVRSALAKRLGVVAAAALVLAPRAPAAEPLGPEPVAEGVVVLPPLEVSTSATPWRYVALPRLEVLSRCADSTTRDFIQIHERIEQLFAAFVPPEFQVKYAVPKIVVLADQKTTPGSAQELIGGFNAGANADAPTIRFLPNLRLNDVDRVAVFAIVEDKDLDSERIGLSRDHMRFVLENRVPPLPAWLLQGLVGLCVTVVFEPDALAFPPVDWVTADEALQIRNDADYPRTLLPMRDLFETRGLVGLDVRADTVRRWAAQTRLFVRWAIDGKDPRRRSALWKLAARGTEPVTDAVVREHFGLGFSDLRDQLSDYLPVALKNTIRLRPEKLTKVAVPKPRLATDAEIGRIKGDWERLEIEFVKTRYPQFAGKYEEQARKTLTKAAENDPHEVGLQVVIALNECDAGRRAEARPMLEAVAQANHVRPRLYVELARLRYTEAAAQPAGRNGLLSAAQANTVLQPLATARTQLPPLLQTYDLAADVWGHSEARLSAAQLGLLDEGLRLFPASLGLLYRVAAVKLLNGYDAEAGALIERGLKLSEAPATKARFEKMQAVLTARRAEAAKP